MIIGIIKSKYEELKGKKFEITKEGIINGLRGVKDGYAYFGSGFFMSSRTDQSNSVISKKSAILNDVEIHRIENHKKITRIFEIEYSKKDDKFFLRDKKKNMGLFVRLENPMVRDVK